MRYHNTYHLIVDSIILKIILKYYYIFAKTNLRWTKKISIYLYYLLLLFTNKKKYFDYI